MGGRPRFRIFRLAVLLFSLLLFVHSEFSVWSGDARDAEADGVASSIDVRRALYKWVYSVCGGGRGRSFFRRVLVSGGRLLLSNFEEAVASA